MGKNPEHSSTSQALFNEKGEQMRPVTYKDGTTVYVTRVEFDNIRIGDLKIPHSNSHGEAPVEEFDMSLFDAHQNGELTDWPSVTKTPPAHDSLKTGFTRRQKVIAGVGTFVAGVTLIGGTYVAATNGDSKTRDQETTSVSPSVVETVDPTVKPTVEPAPIETSDPETEPQPMTDSYVKNINKDPSPAAIEYSLEPVSIFTYTSDEAVERLLDNWKLYWLSGETSQSSDINQTESPSSIAIGSDQIDNIFGPEEFRDESKLLWDWMTGTREYLALNMEFLITENGYDQDATFNSTFTILSSEDLGNGEVEYLVRNDWTSNMAELDVSIATQDVDSKSFSTDRYIKVGQYEGNYHITSIESSAVRE